MGWISRNNANGYHPGRKKNNSRLSVNIGINKVILDSKHESDLIKVINNDLNAFNIVNCCTALHQIAKLSWMEVQVDQLVNKFYIILSQKHHRNELQSRHIANTFWSLAKISENKESKLQVGDKLYSILIRDAINKSRDFKPAEISIIMWSIAKLTETINQQEKNKDECGKLLEKLCSVSMSHVDSFSSQSLCNILWALESLDHYDEPLILHIVRAISHKKIDLSLFNNQEITNSISAITKLYCRYQFDVNLLELLDVILCYFEDHGDNFSSYSHQHIANMYWSLCKLCEAIDCSRINQFAQLFHPLIIENMQQFNSTELHMILYSFSITYKTSEFEASTGHLTSDTNELFDQLLTVIVRHIKCFNSQQLSAAAWSFSNLLCQFNSYDTHVYKAFYQKISKYAKRKIDQFDIVDLSNLLWSYAKINIKKPRLIVALVSQVEFKLADTGGENRHGIEPKHLSKVVWSLAKLNIANESLLREISAFLIAHQVLLNPRDVSVIAWSYAILQADAREMLELFVQYATDNINRFNAQEMSKFLYGIESSIGISDQLSRVISTSRSRDVCINGIELHLLTQLPGRKLKNTGVIAWEASYALAEWLTRNISSLDGNSYLRPLLPGAQGLSGELSGELRGVELGSGVGVVSIVAGKLGLHMVATDGDSVVLDLLSQNVCNNLVDDRVQVKELTWGQKCCLEKLQLSPSEADGINFIFASGVVYGNDDRVFEALVDSLLQLCNDNSLIILCHGQGASPGFHSNQGTFFELMAPHFNFIKLPPSEISLSYRKQNCVIHVFRKKSKSKRAVSSSSSSSDASNKRNRRL